jgi:hypothetical protein
LTVGWLGTAGLALGPVGTAGLTFGRLGTAGLALGPVGTAGLAEGCAGADVEVGVLVVAGVALGCPCHRPTASTTRPASTAVPMTATQIWNQDGPVPFWLVVGWLVVGWLVVGWLVVGWLVACRSGA